MLVGRKEESYLRVKQFARQSGFAPALALLLVCGCSAPLVCVAQVSRVSGGYFPGGSVAGTVTDGEGVPQMGALVQLLLPDTSLAATALTDMHGRYRLSDLKPGNYRVRVSAALFLPVIKQRLQVATGSLAVANMTLSTLLAPTGWLPVTRRASGDADDDWMWTLRSSTMRPVLRLGVEDEQGASTSVSTSANESRTFQTQGRVTVQDSEGGFARGGAHNVLSLERRSGDGAVSFLRADFSGARTPYPVGSSADLSVGWERTLPLGGSSRSVLTYTSHPEVLGFHGTNGMQTAVLRNAERMELGDSVRVDAGSVMRDVNLGGNAIAVEPFFKLAVRASDGAVIAYSFTGSRGTASLEDLDRVQAAVPMATSRDGHLHLERGHYQSLSVSGRSVKGGVVELAVYRDHRVNPALSGSGVLSTLDAEGTASLSDPTTQSFVVTGRDYDSSGVRIVVSQPIITGVAVTGEFADGQVLASDGRAGAGATLVETVNGLKVRNSVTANLALDAHAARSGTHLHAGYRWQPSSDVTAVDGFRDSDESAYLHCKLRQSLRSIPLLPDGLEAVIEVQNLLAEGYRPFVSQDGRVLYLAQAPRALQAGLSFTF